MDSTESLGSSRRRLRKGTFSCQECKRRKKRCLFRSGESGCAWCRGRGLPCLGQDVINDVNPDRVGHRVSHVEGLVSQLLQQRQRQVEQRAAQLTTTSSNSYSWPSIPPSPSASSISISTYLRSVLPSPSEAALIFSNGDLARMPHRLLWHGAKDPLEESHCPPAGAHPVWFGRRLMQLALCLQHIDSRERAGSRYAALVERHVTSLDVMIESLEGLETLMLEMLYYINQSKNRVAWLKCRRAIMMAQLMGLDRRDQGEHAKGLWFRLVAGDRIMSLELGLPHHVDEPDLSAGSDVLLKELQSAHVIISGRIISRNLRMQRQRTEITSEKRDTQAIDLLAKEAMKQTPTGWWVFQSPLSGMDVNDAMAETARLTVQINHFSLLVNLHQPFIVHELRSCIASEELSYNRATLIDACRNVLRRFLTIRNYQPSVAYRGYDFKSMSSAIALVLAHIIGHRHGLENVLEHSRSQDLTMIRQGIALIEHLPHPEPMIKSLKELLEVEEDISNGAEYIWMVGEVVGLHLTIPYLEALSALRIPDHRGDIEPHDGLSALMTRVNTVSVTLPNGMLHMAETRLEASEDVTKDVHQEVMHDSL
ncbi:hypothetical protein S40285_06127 [Stachybotrys chlorohalonatus IBT 40285]|uniref:Zn(2)-C6 fungal-type domain-containing protein n=1 Tax=Stachybotrys chlorohalonatus (strain IBT 40285) TaxID=1283841 RepID=A0A084QP99_STAC4|nr:hypothetical protein S40285_06127 [Stachybotrys chlorohalonata IBT 40285]